jgi:hypothetical protein
MQHYNYGLGDLEMMMPWERELYVTMLLDYLKEEKSRQDQQKMRK